MRLSNFNHIQRWLDPQLIEMGLTAEKFARLCGVSRASIYFYRADITRPTVQVMARMCQVLGVSLVEGLSQYTPRPAGRPRS